MQAEDGCVTGLIDLQARKHQLSLSGISDFFDFGFLASRTVRQYIYVIVNQHFSPPSFTLLLNPRELI